MKATKPWSMARAIQVSTSSALRRSRVGRAVDRRLRFARAASPRDRRASARRAAMRPPPAGPRRPPPALAPELPRPLSPCQPAGPTKRGSGSTEETSMPVISATRRVMVVSSIALKKAISSLPSSFGVASASSGVSSGTSRTSVTSDFEMRMRSTFSGSVNASRRFGCLISCARASSVSRSPYSPISCAAVLTPMPGAPGTLSVESPASAWMSTTLSGADDRNIRPLPPVRCAAPRGRPRPGRTSRRPAR